MQAIGPRCFVPQQGVLEFFENTSTAPKRQCSYNVEVQGAQLHESFQCKLNVDLDIADGTLAERVIIGLPCCTCNKDCLGDTICFHCKLFVHDGHDGKCSKKMQLLEGSEDTPVEGQCTMCTSCARMASRKRNQKSKANPIPLNAGNSTGIAPLNNASMQLRSSPVKRTSRKTSESSNDDVKGTPNEVKETSKETPAQSRTSSKRKADEGKNHCMNVLAPFDLSLYLYLSLSLTLSLSFFTTFPHNHFSFFRRCFPGAPCKCGGNTANSLANECG